MNDPMLTHEKNAFKRDLNNLIDKKCHEFKERTGHKINRISLEYIPKSGERLLTLENDNNELFDFHMDVEEVR